MKRVEKGGKVIVNQRTVNDNGGEKKSGGRRMGLSLGALGVLMQYRSKS